MVVLNLICMAVMRWKWLPRKDSNLRSQIQSLLCYRCTTGQCDECCPHVVYVGRCQF